jgi:hypothetical protein
VADPDGVHGGEGVEVEEHFDGRPGALQGGVRTEASMSDAVALGGRGSNRGCIGRNDTGEPAGGVGAGAAEGQPVAARAVPGVVATGSGKEKGRSVREPRVGKC